MTEVAGEVCDGFICHGFTTEKYLREVTIPALERGRAKAGKTMEGFEIVGPSFVVTARRRPVGGGQGRHPPADRVLRQHARVPAGPRPARVGRPAGRTEHPVQAGKWVEMGNLIDDEVLKHLRRRRRNPSRSHRNCTSATAT